MDEKLEQLKQEFPINIQVNGAFGAPEYVIYEQGQRGYIVASQNVEECAFAVKKHFENQQRTDYWEGYVDGN